MAGFNRNIIDAARDLGANEWHILSDIILPYLRPGLVAGGLVGFHLIAWVNL